MNLEQCLGGGGGGGFYIKSVYIFENFKFDWLNYLWIAKILIL